ncbi:MAG: hypothetical protein E6J70_11245 [Deltaproteobacteria bacterium]|nr:MAG: hypothetical protein E6J70_11245 [Deltaproteobacteria bacterium]
MVVGAAARARRRRRLAPLDGEPRRARPGRRHAPAPAGRGPAPRAGRGRTLRAHAGDPGCERRAARDGARSLLVRLAAVGERGGSLAAALERAARSYEAEVDAAVSAATALLEPLLIVAMGGVVLLLVVAVLVPIFALNQVVR